MAWEKVVERIPVRLLSFAVIVFVASWVVLVGLTIWVYQHEEKISLGPLGIVGLEDQLWRDREAGAVIAFDRSTGCPDGWTDMSGKLLGRVIIGASGDPNHKFGFGKEGGEEEVVLRNEELPAHRHPLPVNGRTFVRSNSGNIAGANEIDPTSPNKASVPPDPNSEGQAHNNMPPYIALYFCKKG